MSKRTSGRPNWKNWCAICVTPFLTLQEQTARTTIERLEEKTRKEQFEWTREQKSEEVKLERILQRLDNLEKYVHCLLE